jgi:RNase P subunit RPR2
MNKDMIHAIKVLISKSKEIKENYDFIMNEIYSLEREYIKLYSEFKRGDIVIFDKNGKNIVCKVLEAYLDVEKNDEVLYVITNTENDDKIHYVHENLFKTTGKYLEKS